MLFKEQLLMTDFFLDRTGLRPWVVSCVQTDSKLVVFSADNHAKSCGSMTTLNTIKEDVEAL